MINALHIAAQGMLKAESRANDVARNILKSTSEAANFKLEDAATGATPAPTGPTATGAQTVLPGGGFGGDLIQQMADLKASEIAFKANAKVFKTTEDTLGSFLDAEG
ncbi:hypothetical protein [Kordiimonas marina]|uniref:hypothetical protein n=1 Tax=Kordiimonas marina TaxID=2872312 RepID=UPI001FF2F266|nr:hypothetical protein [Kordiimonas marina]MCJ9430180.1 hypothetical protein [Kordiimonas marina]